MTTVIALDVGHSAVKCIADSPSGRQQVVFPSVATAALELSEENARRVAARETVEVDGRKFFFGDTAILQGIVDSESGLNDNWITTLQYSALVSGAFLKLRTSPYPITTDDAIIVVGLPAKHLDGQKALLVEVMKKLAPNAKIAVLPQPMGPFMCIQFNDRGELSTHHKVGNESWGIIEIGHYTTDFGIVRNGLWVDKNSDSCSGAHIVVKQVAKRIKDEFGHALTMVEATKAVVEGHVMDFGKMVSIQPFITESLQLLTDEVIDTANRLIDREARGLNGIVVAGGAAQLLFPLLHAKYKHAIMSDDSRMTVAEGFYRFGCAQRIKLNKSAERERDRAAAAAAAAAPATAGQAAG
ncbi:ParM/StbA family protein [Ottowia sp.]|uniref:ParM/StbA family protein n=1 Tax=Ottowia sp. TaxID=1898956 RepID=UPI0025EACC72|nr:ParM/StbA family protein [Ottowia sp.]MBK6616214.1 ParM/StbA family protein [Ottowia sp.]